MSCLVFCHLMNRVMDCVKVCSFRTPRKAGAKMIVYETGMIQGTIGGGCAEANLMQHAREVIRGGAYQIRHVDMTGKVAEEEGMVCGGIMQVLIERG